MGKAAAVRTADAFFDLLQKSRLLTEDQLAEVKEATAGMTDPKAVARRLLKDQLLTRWQAGQLLAGYFALRIGKYKLCEALGRGDMGRVFVAEHGQLGRKVALKALSREHTSKADVLERFLAETRKIADLDHRNVIHLFDIDDEDGRYFVVTEFAEGQDLQAYVEQRGPLEFRDAARIIRQAADGLAFLHERDLTHHDLKPSNLVVTPSGDIKLLDVGVGRLREAMLGEQVNSSGETLVGPRYLSPEQVAGQEADRRSDQFSLGCLLYWMLTATPPYPRATIPFGSVTDVDEIRPDTPAVLAKLCDRLMQLKPIDRTVTAADVVERLDQWLGVDAEPVDKADAIANDTSEAIDTGIILCRSDDTSIFDVGQVASADTSGDDASSAGSTGETDAGQFGGIGAVEGATGFAIKTKKRRGKGKGKNAKTETQAKNAADATETAPKQLKDSKKLLVIIGGGVVAAIAVIGLIAGIFSYMGNGNQAIAQGDTPTDETESTSDDTQQPGENGNDSDRVGDPEIGDPEIGDPEIDDPPADPVEDDGSADVGANNTDEKETVASGTDNAVSVPSENPAAVKPDGVKPDAGKPDGANPEAGKPAAKPPAKPPAKVNPKTNKKPKDTAKAVPKQDPLAGIPKTTELPVLFGDDGNAAPNAFAAKPLGTIVLADKVLCSIYLRGGDGATRAKKVFTIKNANAGLAERAWEFRMEGSSELGDAVVANLEIKDDNKLYFQWTKDAVKDPLSAHLVNCMLNINLTVGGATKDLALRKPVVLEPITLEMERAGAKVRWEIPHPPNPDKVFWTVSKLAAPFPKHVKEPDQPIPANNGGQLIRFGEKEEDKVMLLKLTSKLRRHLEMNVTAFAQFDKAAEMQPINKASLKKMDQFVTASAQQASIRVQQLAVYNPGSDGAKKQQHEQQKNLANQAMAQMTLMKAKMEKLKQLHESLNGQGKLQFRVFYQTEAGDVTLLRTQ